MFLMIDNYDSFVYNLVRYFEELNEKVLIYRNDKITIEEINMLKPEGIIISPGPKSPEDSGICLKVIEHFKGKIPILGICLGHQCIAKVFGANVINAKEPVHGKIFEVNHISKYIFKNIKNPMKVTRYHSLMVDKETLPNNIVVTCETSDGIIMGLRHKEYFVEGLQFHPEAELTEYGHELLQNFINEAKASKK